MKIKKRIALTGLLLLIGLAGFAAAYGPERAVALVATQPPTNPGSPGDDCSHGNSGKPCKPDPQPGHGQDCEDHGKARGNEDHCLDTTTETTTTETTTETTTTTTDTTTDTTTTTAPPSTETTTDTPTQTTTEPPTTTTEPPGTTTPGPGSPPPPVKHPKKVRAKSTTAVKIPGGKAAPGYVPKIVHGHAVITGSG